MSEAARTPELPDEPDVSGLVTEDDRGVESIFQAKQMAILTEALGVSWPEGRPLVSMSDVGLFYAVKEAIGPDVLLSVGVDYPPNGHEKKYRSYFIWQFGKPPDLVIEIVSNREGDELTRKFQTYQEIRVPYYVVFDPEHFLGQRSLRIYQLSGASYVEKVDRYFPELGLGLTLWRGTYDGWSEDEWLRWTNPAGELLATGEEAVAAQRNRADSERDRADAERDRADAERRRCEELEARLRELEGG